MQNLFNMCFPEGKMKAFTMSYDDGVETDIRLAALMRKNGVKGTFNINSGRYAAEDVVYREGQISRRLPKSRLQAFYEENRDIIEIATHGFTHGSMNTCPDANCLWEFSADKAGIEADFGVICRGHAYPYGRWNEKVISLARSCGISYARTVKSTLGFALPEDFMVWHPTCHHTNEALFELADRFLDTPCGTGRVPSRLFYLWGHSYEFDGDKNWDCIEKFLEKMGNRDDIWYATNLEICDYVTAYRALISSADGRRIYNPTAQRLWFRMGAYTDVGTLYCVAPGEEIVLNGI